MTIWLGLLGSLNYREIGQSSALTVSRLETALRPLQELGAICFAAIAALFLVTLILVSLITARLSDFVLDSRIGALDRTLGFVFGAGRGLLLAVIGYLFFTALVPEKMQPPWAREAKAKPLLEETGRSLLTMLPQDINSDIVKKLLKPKTGDEPVDAPAEEPRAPANPTADPQRRTEAPNATDRAGLQRAIEASRPAATPATPARP